MGTVLSQPFKGSANFAEFRRCDRLQVVATESEFVCASSEVRNYADWCISCQAFVRKNRNSRHMLTRMNDHEPALRQLHGSEFFADALGEGVFAEQEERHVRSQRQAD